MTPDGFRKIALSFDGAVESMHHGHPDFRVGKAVFATLGYPDDGWGMAKLAPLQQSQFLSAYPTMFEPAAGAWGQKGSTLVHLAHARTPAVRAALFEAWRNASPVAKPAPAARSRRPRAGGR